MDDHVSKLEHMGKETVKKLSDVHASAVGCGIDISVPANCVSKGKARLLRNSHDAQNFTDMASRYEIGISVSACSVSRGRRLRNVLCASEFKPVSTRHHLMKSTTTALHEIALAQLQHGFQRLNDADSIS